MTRERNQHVVPTKDGWAVRRAGSSRATKVFDTQQEAIEKGREIARNQRSELLIHGRDGTVRTILRLAIVHRAALFTEWERSQDG